MLSLSSRWRECVQESGLFIGADALSLTPQNSFLGTPVPMLSSANKALLKVAGFSAQLEQYDRAIEIYEQVCLGYCQMKHPRKALMRI